MFSRTFVLYTIHAICAHLTGQSTLVIKTYGRFEFSVVFAAYFEFTFFFEKTTVHLNF